MTRLYNFKSKFFVHLLYTILENTFNLNRVKGKNLARKSQINKKVISHNRYKVIVYFLHFFNTISSHLVFERIRK